MSGFAEYDAYDALGLAALVKAGAVSATELVEEAIARCERVNPAVNAVVTKTYERARTASRAIDRGAPFAGVPFLLKDLGQAWAGVPMSCGSRFLVDHVPVEDAEFVRRMHGAGLITLGKTNTPEFGLVGSTEPRLFGPTRNPWRLTHTAGGSSGGAAAAVAAGIVPAAAASDGGGSIRIPAACCGLVGLKPSRGRNPSGPERGEPWYGQVQDGVITRTVRDSAALLDTSAGADAGALYAAPPPPRPFLDEVGRDPGRLRIAVCREALCCEAPLSAECLAVLDDTAASLARLGHHVEYAAPPLDRLALGTAYLRRVMACTGAELVEAASLRGRAPRSDELELTTRAMARLGHAFDAVALTRAQRDVEAQMRVLGRFMRDYDVLLTPTLAQPPVPLGAFEPRGLDYLVVRVTASLPRGLRPPVERLLRQLVANNFRFVVSTMLANMSGEPSISLPLGASRDGLPIGMMFTAPLYEEATLFRLAAQLENALPWRQRRAPHHARQEMTHA